MELVINIDEDVRIAITRMGLLRIPDEMQKKVDKAIQRGTPLPEVHGRLGDLDELEQRISNFVERDARITDEYTVVRQRFIVDGIRQTPTIIEENVAESEDKE